MSLGLNFIRACIEHSARTEFRAMEPECYKADDEAEQRAYEFVSTYLRDYNQFPSVQACLSNRVEFPPMTTDTMDYLVERMRSRHAYSILDNHKQALNDAQLSRSRPQLLEVVSTLYQELSRSSGGEDVFTLQDLSEQVHADYQTAHTRPGRQGVTLGWDHLDRLTGGAEGGDVVTLVARPNQGKSWKLTHMARQAWLEGSSVLLLSMEMTGKQLARRMMGLDAGMNPNYIREGRLSNFGYDRMQQTMTDIRTGAPFHVMQGSFDKSLDAVDRAIAEFAPDIVYIDASYLMAPSKKSNSGKQKTHEVLAAVGTEMKEMAMSRNKPFVQTVQFNREAERAGEERGLAHIGGTDVVGQISTIVVGLQPGPMPFPELSRRMSILKNRENPLGEFITNFLFNPPNFSYRPPEDVAPEDNGGVEAEWTAV